ADPLKQVELHDDRHTTSTDVTDVIAADRRTVCIAQTAAAETRPAARPAALPLWTRRGTTARPTASVSFARKRKS
ncbi:MAG TPA: hypothetical protein VFI54_21535, partial [Solirubrobacteraceae bacterium]|nr:hypothetical protein [Solirubrobacteraceae bacterium]